MKKPVQLLRTLIFLAGIFSFQFARAQCHAAFTYTVNGAAVALTDASTYTGTVLYRWEFGDGSTDLSKSASSHTYQYAGTYRVCLSITDSMPAVCHDTYCDTITIVNAPHPLCSANFRTLIDSVSANSTVYFENTNPANNVKWFWNYGDGSYDTTAVHHVTHHYGAPGMYHACLKAITTMGDTCTFCDSISTQLCWQGLTVGYTHSANNPVSFTSQCSGAAYPAYQWDFGDGTYSYDQNPVHSYHYNGSYTICLTYGDHGCQRTFCDSLTISNAALYPCNALFSYRPDTVNGPAAILRFYDQSSDGIVSWNWSFPGGSPSSSATAWPTVTYPSAGTYSVCLTVTNHSGISCSYCSTVQVSASPCNMTQAYFTMHKDSTPQAWTVYNQSSGAQPASYLWNWGDGTTSTGAAPSHTYTVAGWYNICLTMADANGCGSSYCSHDTLFRFNSNSAIISVHVVSQVTGIAEATLSDAGVSVYPNPANGNFNIKNEKAEIKDVEVYDIYGAKIYNQTLNAKSGVVNLSEAASGIYWLKVYAAGSALTKKLILIR